MSSVLIIGDTHCPAMRRGYVQFLLGVADDYGCNRIVHIGDLVAWDSMSFFNKNTGSRESRAELKKARAQVVSLVKAFPKVDWLLGNHDVLTERQASRVGIPGDFLRQPEELLNCPWYVHPRYAVLYIDGVLYTHGDALRGGQGAALAAARVNFRSTTIGHFHTQAGVLWHCNRDSRIFGLSVGCGIDINRFEMSHNRKFNNRPVLGCGVVIEGLHAYFEPWLLRSKSFRYG